MRLKTRALFSLNIRVYAPGGGGCLSALGAWELPGSVPEHNTRMQRLEAAKTKGPGEAAARSRARMRRHTLSIHLSLWAERVR